MEEQPSTPPALEPLYYHRDVVEFLKANEQTIWEWTASQERRSEETEAVRHTLLHSTYRLEASAHPEIHEHCSKAMSQLGINAPVTLYQASDSEMNASLCYIPGEVHITFYGAILDKLSSDELTAVLGHELSHFCLWSLEGGDFYTANSILEHTLAYPDATQSHFETARLFLLCTEFFADRGAAIAAQSTQPAISTLIKLMTGISSVDAESYLRQAAEVDKAGNASQGTSHPEIFLRAQALDKWWYHDPEIEPWLKRRLSGPLSLGALDLARQHELTELTRKFFAGVLSDPALRSDGVIAQIKRYFPDWVAGGPVLAENALSPDKIDDSIRDYLVALILDLAMADRDVKNEILVAGAKAARKFDGLELLRTALRNDLKMTKSAADRIMSQIDMASLK